MRQLRTSLVVALTVAGAAACGEPTAASGPLAGRWAADATPLQPSGSLRHSLTFTRAGRFTDEWRSYGGYPGQEPDDLSGYTRTTGTYRVDGDRLAFAPETLTTWDRLNGPLSAPTVQTPYPYTGFYDDARFAVAGDVLTINYRGIGPADEPVAATERLRRAH